MRSHISNIGMLLLCILLATLPGFAVVLQAVFNGRIARHYRSVMVAVVCSFIGGDVFMGLATVVLYAARPYKAGLLRDGLPEVDVLLYLSSFFGLILVGGATVLPSKISFATFSTCSVIGQLTASLILDGTGFLRDGKVTVEVAQIVGVGLVVVSTVLFGRAKTLAHKRELDSAGSSKLGKPGLLQVDNGAASTACGDNAVTGSSPAASASMKVAPAQGPSTSESEGSSEIGVMEEPGMADSDLHQGCPVVRPSAGGDCGRVRRVAEGLTVV